MHECSLVNRNSGSPCVVLRDQDVGAKGGWGSKIYRMGWEGSTVEENNKFSYQGKTRSQCSRVKDTSLAMLIDSPAVLPSIDKITDISWNNKAYSLIAQFMIISL